jgi:hypothetical protein
LVPAGGCKCSREICVRLTHHYCKFCDLHHEVFIKKGVCGIKSCIVDRDWRRHPGDQDEGNNVPKKGGGKRKNDDGAAAAAASPLARPKKPKMDKVNTSKNNGKEKAAVPLAEPKRGGRR